MAAPHGDRPAAAVRVEYETRPQRVLFTVGAAQKELAAEVERLGAERVMVIAGGSSAARAEQLVSGLGVVATFSEVQPHVPLSVAEAARAMARRSRADLLVAIGGGSTIGTAKAVALTSGLPIVAVPTTFAGSEATDVWGLTQHDRKLNGSDPVVLPRAVIYDPELVVSLPARVRVASGLNAIAHCVDALWGPSASAVTSALAVEGLRQLATNLTTAAGQDDDLTALQGCQAGTYLAAGAFAAAGSGMHHKICHVLGGAYDLEHASTHAVLLPHVLGFNAPAAPEAELRVAGALRDAGHGDGTDALSGLLSLYDALAAPRSLADLGLGEDQIQEAARLALEKIPDSNPRPVTLDDLYALIGRAQSGAAPERVPLT